MPPPQRAIDYRFELLDENCKPPHMPCYRLSPPELLEARKQSRTTWLKDIFYVPLRSPHFICQEEEWEVKNVHGLSCTQQFDQEEQLSASQN